MPIRSTNLLPSNITKTLVCIDACQKADFAGRMYNPYLEDCFVFSGIYGMINRLDQFFDQVGYPQAFFHFRSFSSRKNASGKKREPANFEKEAIKYMDDSIFNTEKGQRATFVIQVHFRQNATWQGTISWAEEKKIQQFRSTLEMIKLMDDALSDNQELTTNWTEEEN